MSNNNTKGEKRNILKTIIGRVLKTQVIWNQLHRRRHTGEIIYLKEKSTSQKEQM